MDLFKKYNTAGPRYTSYPTVPFWDQTTFSSERWNGLLQTNPKEEEAISLYIHLPFCESMCTFCACHKRITKNHKVEHPYIEAVLREWKHYTDLLPYRPKIAELHLGGGTPSFFSPKSLSFLLNGIFSLADKASIIDYSWEGHPNNTTYDHLKTLYNFGFQRVSFGVQDYNESVQKAINRIQPLASVENVTNWAREIGYTSVSHDLVFGLPFQDEKCVRNTIDQTLALKPDRISFYSYAHVPWIKGNGQRGYDESNLPSGPEKRILYEIGLEKLQQNNYYEVGMDHFAQKQDSLFLAMKNGTLHRNFMGYTVQKTTKMIGLGASAISDIGNAYAQNEKNIKAYQEATFDRIPVIKGHLLNHKDSFTKQQILNIMCRFKTGWDTSDWEKNELLELMLSLRNFEEDGLIELESQGFKVTTKGIPFVRNISMLFDSYLTSSKSQEKLFSKTV